jgi:hypothetical protein
MPDLHRQLASWRNSRGHPPERTFIVPAHVIVHFDQAHLAARGTLARDSPRSAITDRLKRLVADHDGQLSLTPSDPGSSTAPMAMITVSDMGRANALADALRELEGVEAAYSKPGEELP